MTKYVKTILAVMCLMFVVTCVPTHAANTGFKFSLTSTASSENLLGVATKSTDGDQHAYVRAEASKSNLAIKGATVNFRVRDNARNYATTLVTCHDYTRKTMTYLKGKAVGGANYRLYANVSSTNSYPVNVGGVWCP